MAGVADALKESEANDRIERRRQRAELRRLSLCPGSSRDCNVARTSSSRPRASDTSSSEASRRP
eukprot:3025665-Prymnesium_polylepis.1